ncbi:MAG: PAS domain-containing protein, partial [Spirochaetota bacterium]
MNDNESSSSENDSRQLSTGSQTGNGIPSQVLELIYKHTVHKSPVPMLICDIDGNVISYNDSFLLLSGIPHTEHKNLHTLYDIASRWNEYDASGNSTTPQESVLTKNRLQNPHYFKEISALMLVDQLVKG